MAYFVDWANLASEARRQSVDVVNQLMIARDAREMWVTFKGTLTNAQVATAEGVVEADVEALDNLYTAYNQMWSYADNGGTVTSDRQALFHTVQSGTAVFSTRSVQNVAINVGNNLNLQLAQAQMAYRRYWLWRDGRTDGSVATDLGNPATTVSCTDLRLCNVAFDKLWDYWTGVAGTQKNYIEDMLPFFP